MSKRKFGTIKSLLHFDYPYFNEPGDGLGDEVGLETWSKEANAALYGSAAPNAGTQAPKFGYRCLYARGAVIGTNTTGIWNLNSSGDYEIEFFVYPKRHGGMRYLFRLENTELLLLLDMTSTGELRLRASGWEIIDLTGPTVVKVNTWHHVLLRVSEQKLRLFLDGAEELSADLPESVVLEPTSAKIGYFSSTSYVFYIDEFVFRHSAGSRPPKVPAEPYSGVLDISAVGGYSGVGSVCDGDAVISGTDVQLNTCGILASVTDGRTFAVYSWSNGIASIEAGREVMLHIADPKVSSECLLSGLYAFAKVASVEDINVVLDRDITTENGYDFTLSSELLEAYTVNVSSVAVYDNLRIDGTVRPESSWSGGGIIAFRTKGDCSVNGSVLSCYRGPARNDTLQMTHSKLVDRFICGSGGGIFITCGGTFIAGSNARIGADWSGLGENGNGAAGYGGNGGSANPSSAVSVSGGAGGVGGGGGGASSYSTSIYATGGAAGSNGQTSTYAGGGGGGCGGNGGNGTISGQGTGGAGGGGQANSGGTGGTGSYVKGLDANGVHGGDDALTFINIYSGAGGGAPCGNGGAGTAYSSSSRSVMKGFSGASVILICNRLALDEAALSTGGGAGSSGPSGYARTGAAGGGGTGFAYIACREKVSA